MEDPKEQLLLYLGTGHKGQSHVLGMMWWDDDDDDVIGI